MQICKKAQQTIDSAIHGRLERLQQIIIYATTATHAAF